MTRTNEAPGIPRPVLMTALLAVLVCMQLQEPGQRGGAALLLFLFAASLLIPYGPPGLGLSLGILLFLLCFQFRLQLSWKEFLPFEPHRIHTLRGRLTEEPFWMDSRTLRFRMDCDRAIASGGTEASAECGVVVLIDPSQAAEDPFALGRGMTVIVGGAFSSRPARRGEVVFYADDLRVISVGPFHRRRLDFLQAVRRKCGRLGPATEVLLPALVLGMNHPGKKTFSSLFRESGTAHIMALSGFHAGLVGLLLFLAGRAVLGVRGGTLFAAAGLLLFLWLVGFRPSLVRAVVMSLFFALGKLTHRRFQGTAVLLVSYFLCGIIDPPSVASLSSRLSYLALGGIMVSGKSLNSLMAARIPSWLRLPLCASLGAQLWTTGLVLSVFGETYPIGLAASLALTPLVTLYLYLGIFWLILPGGRVTQGIFTFLLGGLERVLQFCGAFFGNFRPFCGETLGPGAFLLLLIPVLLLPFYRPGRFHGKRNTGLKLRLRLRDKNPPGHDGLGTTEAVGAEFPDQPGSQRENHPPSGYPGG